MQMDALRRSAWSHGPFFTHGCRVENELVTMIPQKALMMMMMMIFQTPHALLFSLESSVVLLLVE